MRLDAVSGQEPVYRSSNRTLKTSANAKIGPKSVANAFGSRTGKGGTLGGGLLESVLCKMDSDKILGLNWRLSFSCYVLVRRAPKKASQQLTSQTPSFLVAGDVVKISFPTAQADSRDLLLWRRRNLCPGKAFTFLTTAGETYRR